MADPDWEFIDGFDTYGVAGEAVSVHDDNRWNGGTGQSLVISSPIPSNSGGYSIGTDQAMTKTAPGNFARSIGCLYYRRTSNTSRNATLIGFGDGATNQCAISMTGADGHIQVRRGSYDGTILGSFSLGLVPNGSMALAWDITFGNGTGTAKVWVNGTLVINLTGIDNCATANAYFNYFWFGSGNVSTTHYFDHFWLGAYTAAGGSEVPPLDGPYVTTQYGTSDDSAQFTQVQTDLNYRGVGSGVSRSADRIYMVKVTPDVSGNLSAIRPYLGDSEPTGKLQGLLYADSSNQPGALIATGVEQVGWTAGWQALAFAAPPALVAGTSYWIGYKTNTVPTIYYVPDNDGVSGREVAHTYTGSPPATGASMGSANESVIVGVLTGVAGGNFSPLDNRLPNGFGYNESNTVGHKDLFNFPALTFTPDEIYRVSVMSYSRIADATARTFNLKTKSGATEANGNASGFVPGLSSKFDETLLINDPATGVPFTGNLSGLKHGYEIAS